MKQKESRCIWSSSVPLRTVCNAVVGSQQPLACSSPARKLSQGRSGCGRRVQKSSLWFNTDLPPFSVLNHPLHYMWDHINTMLWLSFYVSAELDQKSGITQLFFPSIFYGGIVFTSCLVFWCTGQGLFQSWWMWWVCSHKDYFYAILPLKWMHNVLLFRIQPKSDLWVNG